jgi:hypothetical protein
LTVFPFVSHFQPEQHFSRFLSCWRQISKKDIPRLTFKCQVQKGAWAGSASLFLKWNWIFLWCSLESSCSYNM